MRQKARTRLLALTLCLTMVLGMMPPITAMAAPPIGTSGDIIAFEALNEEMINQEVALGTSLEELDLPETIMATVLVTTATDLEKSEEPVQDSGKPAEGTATPSEGTVSGDEHESEESESKNVEPQGEELPTDTGELGFMEITIPVPVEWGAHPAYDGETAGVYTFTAEVEGYVVSAPLPEITVTVGEGLEGLITAFAELDQDIRWQRGTSPDLPETLEGTVNGETKDIPVTWDCETDDTQDGLHSFTATPGEGYTIAAGVNAPKITFMRTSLGRMAGAGTVSNPLQITSASQLADIAEAVNNGKLEEIVTGSSIGKVHLLLMNSIDLSGYGVNYNNGWGWIPIGHSSTKTFKGVFDGGGNTITGLYIDYSGYDNTGLFGFVASGAVVKNLGVAGVNITGGSNTGGVAGYVAPSGTVENCYATGSVSGESTTGAPRVGGVVGMNCGDIRNCTSGGTVTAHSSAAVGGFTYAGGIAGGSSGSSAKITNCYSIGTITSTAGVQNSAYAGGIAAESVSGAKIEKCAALNPSVSAIGSPSVSGRVAGSAGGDLTDNYAFSGMDDPSGGDFGGTSGLADINGADMTAADIFADGTLGNLFANNPWSIENGKLPGLNGPAVSIPTHLLPAGQNPFSGGNGVGASTAYQIKTPEQLLWLAQQVNVGNTTYNANGVYYKLMNDIDLSDYGAGWNDNKGWIPIGHSDSNAFNGTFDGGDHKITGLYIDHTSYDYTGLFGDVASGAEVKNLGVAGVSITGGDCTGGVAGAVDGRVENCYSTGSVSGNNCVGGVAGGVNGTVQNCYSTGSVSGNNDVGGVVGTVANNGKVQNCYSTGSVNGNNCAGGVAGTVASNGKVENCVALNPSVSGNNDVGRVAGFKMGGTFTNNYAFSGMADLSGGDFGNTNGLTDKNGADKSVADLQAAGGFPSELISAPWTYANGSLPGLNGKALPMPTHLLPAGQNPFSGGDGTSGSPFQITTADQLAWLAKQVNAGGTTYDTKCYILMEDIDLSDYGTSYRNGAGWEPIGNSTNKFKGNFNGINQTITGLYIDINDSNTVYAGLFGFVIGGTIENLTVKDVNITAESSNGTANAGGIVGYNGGSEITNCTSSGTVTATVTGTSSYAYVGGIAGYSTSSAKITNCHSSSAVVATVTGADGTARAGGIVGSNGGKITNCHSSGTVNATSTYVARAGGIVGYSNSSIAKITNCHSSGAVVAAVTGSSASARAGGIVGENYSGEIANCAALNPSVNASGGTNTSAGRVVGFNNSSSTLAGNIAFSGTLVNSSPVSGGTTDNVNGAPKTASEIQSYNWAGTSDFTTGWDMTNVWDVSSTELPILRNVGGNQDGGAGLYLTAKRLEHATATLVQTSFDYTGNPIELPMTVNFGSATLTENTHYTLSYANNIIPGTSTATATLTGMGEYTGTLTVNFTINKATPKATDFTFSPASATYTGTAQPVTVTPNAGMGTIIVKYEDSTGAPVIDTTDADTYTVLVDVTEGTYYKAASGIALNAPYIIDKRAVTLNDLDITNPGTVDYDGSPHFVTVVPGSSISDFDATIDVYYDTASTPTPAAPTDAGTYTVTAEITGGTNYADTTTPIVIGTLTISSIDIPANDITATGYNEEYDGTAHSISVSAQSGDIVTYSTTEYGSYSTNNLTYTNVGTYTVYYRVERSGGNYNLFFGSETVNIRKKLVTIDGVTADNKVYDGNKSATPNTTNASINGKVSGDDLTFNVGTATFVDKNADNGITVKFSGFSLGGTAAKNYTLSGQPADITADITKASGLGQTSAVTKYVTANSPKSYTVDLREIALNQADFGTISYSYNSNMGASYLNGTPTVVGNELSFTTNNNILPGTNFVIMVDVTTQNYDSITAHITILGTAKEIVTITGITFPAKTYDGNAIVQGGSAEVKKASDGAVVSNNFPLDYSYIGIIADGSFYGPVATAPTDAGTYSLNVSTDPSDSNYIGSNDFNFTINKAVVTVKADDKTALVGGTIPAATVSYSGFEGSDNAANTLATQAVAGHDLGASTAAATFPITFTTQAVLNGTNGTNYTLSHVDGTLTVSAIPQRTISYNANGGAGYMAPDTVNDGSPYTIAINTFTRSNHTFTGWRTAPNGGTYYGAGATIPAVTANITLYAQWSDNSGSGNTGNGGGSSSNNSTITTWTVTPGKTTDMPTTAVQSDTNQPDSSGQLTMNVTKKMIEDGITEAKKKWSGREAYGIALSFENNAENVKSLTATIDADALDYLVAQGVKSLTVQCGIMRITLDEKAIATLDSQPSGNVTITVSPYKASGAAQAAIGTRPVYDITFKDSTGKTISNFGTGTLSIGIAYQTSNAGTGRFSAVYVKSNSEVEWLQNSSYDNSWLMFSRSSLSVYGVGYKPSTVFTDTATHWAKDNIDFAVSRGLFSGTSDTTFSPDTAITRGMFVTALVRLSGADVSGYATISFSDVKADSYYLSYIEWAVKNGIVKGVGENQFAPDRAITREEMAVIMQNYAKVAGYTLPVERQYTAFTDDTSISSWAKSAVIATQQAGIINGKDGGKYDPQGSATRAEAATILRRFVELVVDESTALGWVKNDSGQWQYYNWKGQRTIGWLSVTRTDTKYYFDKNGIMVSGKWVEIGGKWYYFYTDGKLARSTTVEGYKVDGDGVRQGK